MRRYQGVRALWGRLHQPPVVTAAATGMYAGLILGGAMSLIHPPTTIQSEVGPVVTAAWSSFALLGGLLGVVSAPRGIWWLERVGLLSLGTALAIYGATIAGLQVTASGSRWMQLAILGCAAYVVVSRWERTAGAALDPTRGRPTNVRN